MVWPLQGMLLNTATCSSHGNCGLQALEPVYQRLAKRYRKDESLLIAKFDATANDAPANFLFSGQYS